MKRKILSLTLALMMIISVTAAIPVSADTYDIVDSVLNATVSGLGGGPYNTTVPNPTYD